MDLNGPSVQHEPSRSVRRGECMPDTKRILHLHGVAVSPSRRGFAHGRFTGRRGASALGQECHRCERIISCRCHRPHRAGMTWTRSQSLVADIKGREGGNRVLPKLVAGGWGEGKRRRARPRLATRPALERDPPETLKALRSDAGMSILTACGIPPSLVMANSDGTAQRESYQKIHYAYHRTIDRDSPGRARTEARNGG